jgi:VWFA-related protein
LLVHRLIVVCLVSFIALPVATQENTAPPDPDADLALEALENADSSQQLPVFRGELDVNLVNLFVSVIDDTGRPVHGLTIDDFQVLEDNRKVEITNFEAVQRSGPGSIASAPMVVQAEGGVPSPAVEASVGEHGRYVALVFDGPSLERRSLRKIVESLEEFVRDGLAQDDKIMIARIGDRLEIVKPFTANEPALMASLKGVGDFASAGDPLKKRKRALKRSVYRSDMYRMQPRTGGLDTEYAMNQIMFWRTELDAIRQQEAERIRMSLGVVDELLRALAGIDGRKSVVFVGQDLAIRPAVDIYSVFYSKAAFMGDQFNLVRPEVWGEELTLVREFQALAASAQSSGATFFVIDPSDRDMEMGSADFGSSNALSVFAAEAAGENWTPGADMSEIRGMTEGGHYMALASGGSLFANTRKMENVMDSLSAQVSSYYYIGYFSPKPPDGKRHSVQVKVRGSGLRVRHHQKVLSRTAPQRLADLAYSRLRLDEGDNPLGLELHLEEPEPADAGRLIQPVQLNLPVANLVLLPDASSYVGQILVAVVVLDGNGFTAPPQLIRLRLRIPTDQYSLDKIATQRVRLLMREGTTRIALSVRDEVSGVESSGAIATADPEL